MNHEDRLRLFHRLVTAPENVERTIDALGIARQEVERAFAGDDRLDAVGRLDVYANMFFFRIRDVLAEQFERVAEALGEAGFHDLVTDYLLACPPRTPSLREVGDRLPEFLREHEVSREHPWLPDLAALEWARLEVFDEADTPLLDLDHVRSVSADAFGSIPLALAPAVRVLHTEWDVSGEPVRKPATILVWRHGVGVVHRTLDALERDALALVAERCTFDAVTLHLATRLPDDQLVPMAFELLARWVTEGLLLAPPS